MVMHSNERGECDLRTLLDRQRKRLVDVVVLAVIQITDDQVPNGQHLRVQHTYGADNVSRTLIQQGGGRG